MSDGIDDSATNGIKGQLLRVNARREVAIYLRAGELWIADFIDGEGELVEPRQWFRFNCGTPMAPAARRRMQLEAAMPLSTAIARRIERLHRQAESTSDTTPNPVGSPSLSTPTS